MSKVVRQPADGDKEEPPSERGTAAPENFPDDLDELFAEAKQVDDLFQLFSWLRRLR